MTESAARDLPHECRIAGRTVIFEPGLPKTYSAITLFAEPGFAIGPAALASVTELYQTVMHELYRLEFSAMLPTRGATVGGAQTGETGAARDFAQRALKRMEQETR